MKLCSHTYETDTLKALGCVLLSFFIARAAKEDLLKKTHDAAYSPIFLSCFVVISICGMNMKI
jgi:hypothetical protein